MTYTVSELKNIIAYVENQMRPIDRELGIGGNKKVVRFVRDDSNKLVGLEM